MRGSPQEIASKWSARASAAQGDYAAGVERTTDDPGRAAAAAADKWQANVTSAKDRYRARVGAVSAAEWKRATVEKGAPRYGTGVQQAQDKFGQFMSEFAPHLEGVTARVKAMPSTTLEQRIERSRQQQIGTAQFRRRGGGGMGA